jgi:hypothetical protein
MALGLLPGGRRGAHQRCKRMRSSSHRVSRPVLFSAAKACPSGVNTTSHRSVRCTQTPGFSKRLARPDPPPANREGAATTASRSAGGTSTSGLHVASPSHEHQRRHLLMRDGMRNPGPIVRERHRLDGAGIPGRVNPASGPLLKADVYQPIPASTVRSSPNTAEDTIPRSQKTPPQDLQQEERHRPVLPLTTAAAMSRRHPTETPMAFRSPFRLQTADS